MPAEHARELQTQQMSRRSSAAVNSAQTLRMSREVDRSDAGSNRMVVPGGENKFEERLSK